MGGDVITTANNVMTGSNSFTGPVVIGSTNLVTALSGKQPLDTDLTALANGTAIPTAITNSVSVGAPTIQASSKLTIPQSDDPDVSAAGEISWDTDGWLRAYDIATSNQVAIARKLVQIDATVYKPNDLDDAQRDALYIWSNRSGMNFIVTGWYAESTSDNTDLTIKTMTSSGGSVTTVDAVSITTDGTGMFYGSDTTVTSATIATGNILFLDFDDTDTPSMVHITITGYYDANVN